MAFWYLEEAFLLTAKTFIILQGLRDETFGMPLPGVILNTAWALLFSFYVSTVYLVDQVSFFMHFVILFQVIVYGPKEFFAGQRVPLYVLLVICTVPTLGLVRALIDEEGRQWSHNQLFYAFMLVTSILFVHMLLSRGDARGQNMVVAVCKCAGMACGWLYQHTAVVSWLCFGSFLADVVYIYLLYLCLEKPTEFHTWRNFLVNETPTTRPLMVNRHNNGVIYHPPPVQPPVMTDHGEIKNTDVEMLSGTQ